MKRPGRTSIRTRTTAFAALAATAVALLAAAPAGAVPPFDGTTVSPGLGPTFGEPWCAAPAPGSSIANQQGSPLALIPYEAFGCTLDKFQAEATAAGLPHRFDYSIIGQSAGGRNMWGVVVNALETPNQIRDYQRWQQLRAIELTDPTNAAILLNSWGGDVKMPIFIEANIHGDEEEGADAIMQAIRDLVTTPYGVNPTVDKILDHAILIVIPNQNPDGRFIGQRANANNFDMNRDFLVQSQSETRTSIRLQQEFLATAGLAMHGYVNPTLIDGLTKPHNPGLEYDIFAYWNQLRVDANQAALAAVGMGITRPVAPGGLTGYTGYCSAANGITAGSSCGASTQRTIAAAPGGATQAGNIVTITTTAALSIDLAPGARVTISGVADAGYNGTFQILDTPTTTSFRYTNPTTGLAASGGGTAAPLPSPANAEGWDDWGPFYTQTYMAFYGPDSSTLEMCSSGAGCNGRFGSKRAQYIGFYSSADFWLDHRSAMMKDQIEMFRRGVADADRPQCCFDPLLVARGFTEEQHNWMVPYPKAFVIPFNGDGQRSDAEANRMAQWLLDNGIQVRRMTSDFTWGSTTYPAGSYVVYMNQALRGLAYTTLAAGQDVSARITQLYAPPGAWSHGLLWGADVAEIPRGDASFAPVTAAISAVNPLTGGIAGGAAAPADYYSVALRGPSEVRAILSLLRGGTTGEIAEASFATTTGGTLPAGSMIFPNDPGTKAAIDAAGAAAGITFERSVGLSKPATTQMKEAPKVAILVNSANPANSDTSQSLKAIFGADAIFVSVLAGANSIQLSPSDPLAGIDVIYNTGQGYPAAANTTARARLNAFFARGGGYIATGVSTTNYSFLTGAVPALVNGGWTQTSSSAGGGIVNWQNTAGADSPVTGAYPASDYLYMPSNVTYYTVTPTGAVVDGRNNANMVGTAPNGPSPGFVAGLWRNRAASANNAPVIIHGATTAGSRYVGLSTNPFSRQDAEREWTLIGQAALWSNLTDELGSTIDFPAAGGAYANAGFDAGCGTPGGDICGTAAQGSSPAALAKVQVAVQRVSTGQWWDGTGFASATPVYADAVGTASWSFAFPAAQFPADGDYVVRAKAVDAGGNEQLTPASATFTIDNVNPTSAIGFPAGGGVYNGAAWAAGCGTPADDVCGTAADAGGSGPASVRWSLRRNSTGLYWTGASFSSASPVFLTADGAASWSDDLPFGSFPGDGAYTLSARATDRAGNEEATSTATFVVDTTAPTSNAVLSGTVNLDWWRNPTVTITATDGTGNAGVQKIEYRLDGGPFQTYAAPFVVTGDGVRTLEYRATDNLGHVEATRSLTFKVDGNAPTTTASVSPAAQNGFHRSAMVTLTGNDGAGSGVVGIQYTVDGSGTRSYTGPFAVPSSGSHTITFRSADLTGLLETTKTITFSVDAVAPVTTAVLSPGPTNGFYRGPTTVALNASDALSGVDSVEYLLDSGSWTTYTGPFVVTGDGAHTVQFHATDKAGNVEAMKTKTFTIDTTAPTITMVRPTEGEQFALFSSPAPSFSCSDAVSGVSSCFGPGVISTGPVGPHTFTVTSTDLAGNTRTVTTTYNVYWPGFAWTAPTKSVDAGKDVAVKFTLGGQNRGLAILAAGSPTSRQVDCTTGSPLGPFAATTAGSGGLSYGGGTYTYPWKTQSAWKKSCRELHVELADGTGHSLTVTFK